MPWAAAVAAATVMWTVRHPAQAGMLIVRPTDVPNLAWLAAGRASHILPATSSSASC